MGYIHYFYGLVSFLFFPLKGKCTKLNLTFLPNLFFFFFFLPNLLSQWSSNFVNVRIPGIGLPDLAIKNIEHAVNFKFQLNIEEFCYKYVPKSSWDMPIPKKNLLIVHPNSKVSENSVFYLAALPGAC